MVYGLHRRQRDRWLVSGAGMGVISKPSFSWSLSRQHVFERCKRQYWYRYYGYWHGGPETFPEDSDRIQLLKQRTSTAEWLDRSVHRAIADYLVGDESPELVQANMEQCMRDEFAASASRRFREPGQATSFGLLVHELESSDAEPLLEASIDQAMWALQGFFALGLRRWLHYAKKKHGYILIDHPMGPSFDHNLKVKVPEIGWVRTLFVAVPDFAVIEPGGQACLLDWRTGILPVTGEIDDTRYDLAVQSLWLTLELKRQGWRLADAADDPGLLEVRYVNAQTAYLPTGASYGALLPASALPEVAQKVCASIGSMIALCTEVESERDVARTWVPYDACDPVSQAPACRGCAFATICDGAVS